MIDGVGRGEVRSAAGDCMLFQQRDDGFASFGHCGGLQGGLFGVTVTIP